MATLELWHFGEGSSVFDVYHFKTQNSPLHPPFLWRSSLTHSCLVGRGGPVIQGGGQTPSPFLIEPVCEPKITTPQNPKPPKTSKYANYQQIRRVRIQLSKKIAVQLTEIRTFGHVQNWSNCKKIWFGQFFFLAQIESGSGEPDSICDKIC